MEDQFTLQEWLNTDPVAFSLTEEQIEKLRAAAEVFHNLAAEFDMPYVLSYITGQDADTCSMVTCSQLVPMERSSGELLVSFTASTYGITDVMNLIYSMGTGK